MVIFGRDEEAKKVYYAEKAPLTLEKLDKVVAKHGGPFVLGKTFSFVDLSYYLVIDRHLTQMPELMERFPHLGFLHAAVIARPNIAAYLASNRVPK